MGGGQINAGLVYLVIKLTAPDLCGYFWTPKSHVRHNWVRTVAPLQPKQMLYSALELATRDVETERAAVQNMASI